MSRFTGRLHVKDMLVQQNLDLPPTVHQSASLLKIDKELKEVKDENRRLKVELQEERSMLEQLLNESKQEKYDERRINLLKAQIIQLERQTLILTEALGCRSENLLEVENALRWVADEIRSYIAADIKGSNVPVSRADLMAMVEKAESARIKLFKGIENNSKENLAKSTMFMSHFVKRSHQNNVTLLDIASGQLSHLNLKHVGNLESKLSQLFKELTRLNESLCEAEGSVKRISSGHMTEAFKQRLISDVLKSSKLCKDCSSDLLCLSLLYPAAPWSALKRPVSKEVTIEEFMSILPTLPKQKSADVQQCIDGLLKTCNYRQTMLEREVKALREEVKFHQKVYDHQLTYIESLFTAVKDGYMSFENSVHDVVVGPLKEALKNYEALKTSGSEKALRDFLSNFKNNESKLQSVVDKLELLPEQNGHINGAQVLSSFGEEFFHLMDRLVVEQQEKRDAEIGSRRDMKEEQELRETELKQLTDKLKEKKIRVRELKDLKEFDIPQEVQDMSPVALKKSSSESSISKNNVLMEQLSVAAENVTDNSELDSTTVEDNKVTKMYKPPLGREKSNLAKLGQRSKQPLNYETNLVIPNRTLKLRKSNSISKLNCVSASEQSLSDNDSLLRDVSTLSMSSCESQSSLRPLAPLRKKKNPFY